MTPVQMANANNAIAWSTGLDPGLFAVVVLMRPNEKEVSYRHRERAMLGVKRL
jgi:hypothetical protein